jgi:hypothetical protein
LQVWPYLLGHYAFGSSCEEREAVDRGVYTAYEHTMSEWLAVEAIVKQRDKEIVAANLAKMSQESTDGHIPLVRKDSSLSNDVFESYDESDDFSHPETLPEESSATGTTCCTPTMERKVSMELDGEEEELEQTPATQDQHTDQHTDQHMEQHMVPHTDPHTSSLSYSDSPDDGLGDSTQERSKLDSAGSGSMADSEGTDISRPDVDGRGLERSVGATKSSVDSAGVDDDYVGGEALDHYPGGEAMEVENGELEEEEEGVVSMLTSRLSDSEHYGRCTHIYVCLV